LNILNVVNDWFLDFDQFSLSNDLITPSFDFNDSWDFNSFDCNLIDDSWNFDNLLLNNWNFNSSVDNLFNLFD
jgi:hypothetical protein